MEIDAVYFSAFGAMSLGAIATALINFGEMREHKKNINEKVNANKKDSDERANYNFYLLKDEMAAHERRDDERQKEIIERIERAEDNIIKGVQHRQ